jgi:hypothetical protein
MRGWRCAFHVSLTQVLSPGFRGQQSFLLRPAFSGTRGNEVGCAVAAARSGIVMSGPAATLEQSGQMRRQFSAARRTALGRRLRRADMQYPIDRLYCEACTYLEMSGRCSRGRPPIVSHVVV